MPSPGALTLTEPAASIPDITGEYFRADFVPGEVDARMVAIEVQVFDHQASHTDEVTRWTKSRDAETSETALATFSVALPQLLRPDVASAYGYKEYCWRARAKDTNGEWTPWTSKSVFAVSVDVPSLTGLTPDGLTFSTLTGVRFSGLYSDPIDLPCSHVHIQARPSGAATWSSEDLVWDSGRRTVGEATRTRPGLLWGGSGLGPGSYEWRIEVYNELGSVSNWFYGDFILTEGWEEDPGAQQYLTGYERGHTQARIVIRSVDFGTEEAPGDRGPVDPPVAVIYDAAHIGAGEWLNSVGEIFWTLPNDHPQISVLEPYLVHYALEHYEGEGWKEKHAGLLIDFSATADETVFYGIDYLGLLSKMYDERFSPKGPDTSIEKGGAKYVNKRISYIIQDQLKNAKAGDFSPTGFIRTPTIADWDERITIISTFKERLSFILGLMDSHAAGTGKRTRIRYLKDIDGNYRWDVQDTSGTTRDNLRFEYGGLVQGFEVVPFEDFGTRVMGIGRTVTGTLPMYAEAWPPDDADTDDPFPEWYYGRFPKIGLWQDLIDKNDLKRRAALLARRTGKVGKRVGIGIRVDALRVKDGWDITDMVPIRIDRGPVNTANFGSGYWVIAGWQWMLFPDGHTDLILSFMPKDDDIAVDLTIIDSDPIPITSPWLGGCGHPATIAVPDGIKFYFDHCSGLIYERDDCTDCLDDFPFEALALLEQDERDPDDEGWGKSLQEGTYWSGDDLTPNTDGSTAGISPDGAYLYSGDTYVAPAANPTSQQSITATMPGDGTVSIEFAFKVDRNILDYEQHANPDYWPTSRTATLVEMQLGSPATVLSFQSTMPSDTFGNGTDYTVPTVVTLDPPTGATATARDTELDPDGGTYADYNPAVAVVRGITYYVRMEGGPWGHRVFMGTAPNPSALILETTGGKTYGDEELLLFLNRGLDNRTTEPGEFVDPLAITTTFRQVGWGFCFNDNGLPDAPLAEEEPGEWATEPSDVVDSSDFGVVPLTGEVFVEWAGGTASARTSRYDIGPIDLLDTRFLTGFDIVVDCYADHLPGEGIGFTNYARWIVGIVDAADVVHEVTLSISFDGPELGGLPNGTLSGLGATAVEVPDLTNENTLRVNVSGAGVVSATVNGYTLTGATPYNVANGIKEIRIGLNKRDALGVPLEHRAIPLWHRTEKVIDCWKVRPPVEWDPDDPANPFPLPGQYVEERTIATGDGVNAYFYLLIDGYAIPYAPGSVRIKVDGIYQDVGEADPATGLILLDFIPEVGETITAQWRRAVT